ncbi:MAG: hypothetical protein FWG54_06130 [Bacteroidetes bacterium]|nr:hypothetical protein [Bacteroidota bacterium]
MKFSILPNSFKKIGIALFFVAIAAILGLSIYANWDIVRQLDISETQYFDLDAFSAGTAIGTAFGNSFKGYNDQLLSFKLCSFLLLLGIACYMLAKEKVEDELMDALRWESIRLSILICLGITFLYTLIGWIIPGRTLLFVLFFCYLITFQVKKSNIIKT